MLPCFPVTIAKRDGNILTSEHYTMLDKLTFIKWCGDEIMKIIPVIKNGVELNKEEQEYYEFVSGGWKEGNSIDFNMKTYIYLKQLNKERCELQLAANKC